MYNYLKSMMGGPDADAQKQPAPPSPAAEQRQGNAAASVQASAESTADRDDGWSLGGALAAASELMGLEGSSEGSAAAAPTAEQIRAHTLDSVARATPRFHKDGQWTYAQFPNGTIQITEGPGAGQVLQSGKAYEAITKLMGPHPAQSEQVSLPVSSPESNESEQSESWPEMPNLAKAAANQAVDLGVWAASQMAGPSESVGESVQTPAAAEVAPGDTLDRLLARDRLNDEEIR
ncbi:MAG: hypothetical protein AB8H79_17500, partial [Myxococcota bacterium]